MGYTVKMSLGLIYEMVWSDLGHGQITFCGGGMYLGISYIFD